MAGVPAWKRQERSVAKSYGGKRNLNQTRESSGCDVESPLLIIQCKTGKRPNPHRAWREAQGSSRGTGKMPVAICHWSDERLTLVTMERRDFDTMLAYYEMGIKANDDEPAPSL